MSLTFPPMFESIDRFLNRTTMYRLALYVIVAELAMGAVLGLFGAVPFGPTALILSAAVLVAACVASNALFARVFRAPVNRESAIITALILALIITPVVPLREPGLGFLLWAAVFAMASKYALAADRDHVFNPAAFAVALTAIVMNQSASWWVGSLPMLPVAAIGGAMLVRKIRRFDLVAAYAVASMAAVAVTAASGAGAFIAVERTLLHTPLVFFATIMLTEPLTTPPTRPLRIAYGALVGILSLPSVHVGTVFSTPELALLAGNLFSYVASPTGKFMLTLEKRIPIGKDAYEFVFAPSRRVPFRAGQYMEWTLPHRGPDDRGERRYFTASSSPQDETIRVGVKFYPGSSSFKKRMMDMARGDAVMAGEISGDFVLPRDPGKKLAFIAGGIGVTPFRSMVEDLIDRGERRSVVMLYSNRTIEDVSYRETFERARARIGMKTVYALTDVERVPQRWDGHRGMLDAETIAREIPDYAERLFYLSGPRSMVVAFEEALAAMGVRRKHIKTDYFPGFA